MQDINLFQPQFQREQQPLAARFLMGCLALVVVAIVASVSLVRQHVQHSRAEVRKLTDQQVATAQRYERLVSQYSPKQKSPLLAAEIEKVNAELIATRRAAAAVADGRAGQASGFSGFFYGIAHRHIDGVWITGVSITEGGRHFKIEGQALAPTFVTRFLQSLGQEAAFAGKLFDELRLVRTEQGEGGLHFLLSTTALKEAGKRG